MGLTLDLNLGELLTYYTAGQPAVQRDITGLGIRIIPQLRYVDV